MYHFTPPTKTFKAGTDSLWGRVNCTVGLAVVIYDDGRIATVAQAPSTSDEGVATVYPGGRTYPLTDEQAAPLLDAGYSQYLEVVA